MGLNSLFRKKTEAPKTPQETKDESKDAAPSSGESRQDSHYTPHYRGELTRMDDVETLMMSSKDESEWSANCDKVKAANGGDYPNFWAGLEQGGLRELTVRRWQKQN
jgi:hypothetical protein